MHGETDQDKINNFYNVLKLEFKDRPLGGEWYQWGDQSKADVPESYEEIWDRHSPPVSSLVDNRDLHSEPVSQSIRALSARIEELNRATNDGYEKIKSLLQFMEQEFPWVLE